MTRPDTVYFYVFESLDLNAYGHTWGLEAEMGSMVDDPDDILRDRGLNPERFVLLRIREVGPGEERVIFDAWVS